MDKSQITVTSPLLPPLEEFSLGNNFVSEAPVANPLIGDVELPVLELPSIEEPAPVVENVVPTVDPVAPVNAETLEVAEPQFIYKDATCQSKAVYYKSC